VAKSVALTGSDPYFRTGTDMAVLFEAERPELLENLLLAKVMMASNKTPGAKLERGEIDGLAYRGVRSPDRSVCSYIARLGDAVVVTNSLYQLERLSGVANKKSPSIASLPEYVFFRDRYRLGDPEETRFVFLSDATIRRWSARGGESPRRVRPATWPGGRITGGEHGPAGEGKTANPARFTPISPRPRSASFRSTAKAFIRRSRVSLGFMTPVGRVAFAQR